MNCHQIPNLLNLLLPALAKILLPSHIEQALLCVRRMALTHFTVTVEHLLAVPLLLPNEAIRMFITIAKTPELVLQLLNTLLSTLNDSPFNEVKPVAFVRAVRSSLGFLLVVHEYSLDENGRLSPPNRQRWC